MTVSTWEPNRSVLAKDALFFASGSSAGALFFWFGSESTLTTWLLAVAAALFTAMALLFVVTMWMRHTVTIGSDGTLTVRWLKRRSMLLGPGTTCDIVNYDLGISDWFDTGAAVLIVDDGVADPIHIPRFLVNADLAQLADEVTSRSREPKPPIPRSQ